MMRGRKRSGTIKGGIFAAYVEKMAKYSKLMCLTGQPSLLDPSIHMMIMMERVGQTLPLPFSHEIF
jgi:hypothetical protein